VIENCEFTAVGATATEDAAADGTACQDGTVPVPFDVNTKFVLPADNFAKEVPVDATKISPIVYELNPVPPYKAVITVPAQVPEVITPTVLREANEVTSVATNVLVPDGNVALVVAVVVRVKLFVPDVISEDPSAIVSVEDVAGAEIVTLL
jgi:hypothetical protein